MVGLLLLVVGGYLSVAVTAASVFRGAYPEFALRLAPWDARAKAALSETRLNQGGEQSDLAEAAELSRDALRRDPTVLDAWRSLALIAAASGRQSEAAELFETAHRLSRRDAPTQLWLIEENVRRDNVAGALFHYDVALRTSRRTRDLLIPILVSASDSPPVAGPLTKLLSRDPNWASHYFQALAHQPPSTAAAADLVSRLPRPVVEAHMQQLRPLVQTGVANEDYAEALRIYRLLSGSDGEFIRNSDFRGANEFPPLEWQLTNDMDLRAEPSGGALRVSASSGSVGVAAQQLLVLDSGEYRVSSVVASEAEPRFEQAEWVVECVDAGAGLVRQQAAPRASGTFRYADAFRVPASGCPAQWLRLHVSAPDTPAEAVLKIDRINIHAR